MLRSKGIRAAVDSVVSSRKSKGGRQNASVQKSTCRIRFGLHAEVQQVLYCDERGGLVSAAESRLDRAQDVGVERAFVFLGGIPDAVAALFMLTVRASVSGGEEGVASVAGPTYPLAWLLVDTLYCWRRIIYLTVLCSPGIEMVQLYATNTAERRGADGVDEPERLDLAHSLFRAVRKGSRSVFGEVVQAKLLRRYGGERSRHCVVFGRCTRGSL